MSYTEFIFDLETTGLPKRPAKRQRTTKPWMPPPEDLDSYEECQIVSIAWVLVSHDGKIIQQEYYIVTPPGEIPLAATKIHGISTSDAATYGYDISDVIPRVLTALRRCQKIVSYNIAFDYNVLKSTLIRYNYAEALQEIDKKAQLCTMLLAQDYMAAPFWPSLGNAYKYVFNQPIQDAHNAMGDVISTYKLYNAIRKKEPDEPQS